jgi:hypothetical protein
MRQTRGRFALTLGSILLLVITAAASIGLNTDLSAPPRFDGAGYAVLGEALASGRGYREITTISPRDIRPLWRSSGGSRAALSWRLTFFRWSALSPPSSWRGSGFGRFIHLRSRSYWRLRWLLTGPGAALVDRFSLSPCSCSGNYWPYWPHVVRAGATTLEPESASVSR